jgi:hypothetical protein
MKNPLCKKLQGGFFIFSHLFSIQQKQSLKIQKNTILQLLINIFPSIKLSI